MALDTQIAHAMAPKAKIYVVECAGACASNQEILNTEKKASELVAAAGGGEVSNSWSWAGEFSGETQYDMYFRHKSVVYFVSAGDSPGVEYPGTSPNVVSAGGTTINRNGSGYFTSESAWSSSGGGPSQYELRPAYQDIVKKIVGSYRGTPDVSFEANPNTGPAVLDTYGYGGWVQVGGTSVSAPALAGIFNGGGHFYQSTPDELTAIYKEYGNPTEYKEWFRNITIGNNAYQCKKGYTFCAGVGTPLTFKGK
jgi:subtilase family serine protease